MSQEILRDETQRVKVERDCSVLMVSAFIFLIASMVLITFNDNRSVLTLSTGAIIMALRTVAMAVLSLSPISSNTGGID